MRGPGLPTLALGAAMALIGGAALANTCQTDTLTCATTMPVGGYCECSSHGAVQGGTVVVKHTPHRPLNSTAGGCGTNPNAPGCH
ncbi:MAG TPA: hypothetical protein VME92_07285 [Acetobacteraceae bacterium]|nr:hypothetical protein [Acetobacteraceae bacterium]